VGVAAMFNVKKKYSSWSQDGRVGYDARNGGAHSGIAESGNVTIGSP
jgi:hypothetical protein